VAFAAIGTFHNAHVDTTLLQGAQDPAPAVRQVAIQHLGRRSYLLHQLNLVDVLLPGLWDLHPEVNQATAMALGRLGTEPAIQSLARVLRSPHTPENLQVQIVRSLGWNEKESALRSLAAAYTNASLTIRLEIVRVLSQVRPAPLRQYAGEFLLEWLALLLQATDDHAALKQTIALGLSHLQCHGACDPLQTMLQDSNAQNRLYAEAALRQLSNHG
jgi:HEAT repeat protein